MLSPGQVIRASFFSLLDSFYCFFFFPCMVWKFLVLRSLQWPILCPIRLEHFRSLKLPRTFQVLRQEAIFIIKHRSLRSGAIWYLILAISSVFTAILVSRGGIFSISCFPSDLRYQDLENKKRTQSPTVWLNQHKDFQWELFKILLKCFSFLPFEQPF